MYTAKEIRQKYIDFFVKKHAHKQIPSASVVPENDPTVLFTTAGMQPLVPYLMGEKHPAGTRLVDSQKCIRTDDIEEVGDDTHCTFFEMLGNWSLGDYFKKESIEMSYELLTSKWSDGGFEIAPDRLRVTCFEGDDNAPRDEEAAGYWKVLGFVDATSAAEGERRLIYFYEKKKNWWGPAGQTGPCGPDTEIFFDRNPELGAHEHRPGAAAELINKYPLKDGSGKCHPNCECGRYVEIWNNVFMQFNKKADGSFEELTQKNVDTGMGFERIVAVLQGVATHYETELFRSVREKIRELAGGEIAENEENMRSGRIIADHLRAATFILGDKMAVTPSNTDQGYILRRLIRRAIRHGRKLGINGNFTHIIAEIYIAEYGDVYDELTKNRQRILTELEKEEEKFQKTLENGLREMKKLFGEAAGGMAPAELAEKAFFLYESYGFPQEMIVEELEREGLKFDTAAFANAFQAKFAAHQALSRAGAEQKFAGGLADHSDESRKLHTATHLLHEALKKVLGREVEQRGSNITPERLRFDFNYPQKMTAEQIKQVEDLVNDAIARKLPISFEVMTVDEAKKQGAIGLFEEKYGDQIKVYRMGDFSLEICGGPHADNTGDLKHFKIVKE
ncbi:alanine--tRNA ligase, partial [Candidatus Peregrinibacteria bacterium]|nr:alanine--tRNA ligase [Candidatus Peregrinibacteria bacterium]